MKKILLLTILLSTICFATVSEDETVRQFFTCNGTATTFTFTIPCNSADDIVVYEQLISTGAQTLLVKDTNYTIAYTAPSYLSGGVVTIDPAPASTYKVVIERMIKQSQETSSSAVNAISIVSALDKSQRINQDLYNRWERSLHIPGSEVETSMELPSITERKNLGLAFDANGVPYAAATYDHRVYNTNNTFYNVDYNDSNFPCANVEYYGAKGGDDIDDTVAIQAAIDHFPTGYGKVVFPDVGYKVSTPIIVTKPNIILEGIIPVTRQTQTPTVISTSNILPVLKILGTTAGGDYDGTLEDVTIKDMFFSRSTMGIVGSLTVQVQNTIYTTFNRCGWALSQYGLVAINVGGLRLNHVMATVGGDVAGSVYGTYIDGSLQSSTGILIDDYVFYGSKSGTYGTPSGDIYAYYDYSVNALGNTLGDRRIDNFEVSGDIDYGIWMQDGGGFSEDVQISRFTMDNIQKGGITLKSSQPYLWQSVNVSSGWINLNNETGTSYAIKSDGRAGTNIGNVSIQNSGSNTNIGLSLLGFRYGVVDGITIVEPNNYSYGIYMNKCATGETSYLSVISNVVLGNSAPLNVDYTQSCIFNGINGTAAPFTFTANTSYNHIYASTYSALTDSGNTNTKDGFISASKTWNPPAILDGDEDVNSVTVTGAVVGDFASASFSIDVNDLNLTARVISADTVECQFSNNTGGTVNLNSGTVYVRVGKK